MPQARPKTTVQAHDYPAAHELEQCLDTESVQNKPLLAAHPESIIPIIESYITRGGLGQSFSSLNHLAGCEGAEWAIRVFPLGTYFASIVYASSVAASHSQIYPFSLIGAIISHSLIPFSRKPPRGKLLTAIRKNLTARFSSDDERQWDRLQDLATPALASWPSQEASAEIQQLLNEWLAERNLWSNSCDDLAGICSNRDLLHANQLPDMATTILEYLDPIGGPSLLLLESLRMSIELSRGFLPSIRAQENLKQNFAHRAFAPIYQAAEKPASNRWESTRIAASTGEPLHWFRAIEILCRIFMGRPLTIARRTLFQENWQRFANLSNTLQSLNTIAVAPRGLRVPAISSESEAT